ncbi:MAG TPA: hypothetical protein VD757_00125 [Candidatus Nitrosocosmicus sp.]|nr:hypothetical protein [Candidatus Nitrosocosmicus sp.]
MDKMLTGAHDVMPLFQAGLSLSEQQIELLQGLTSNFLYALMEHLDDCDNIISCYIARKSKKEKSEIFKSFKDKIYEDCTEHIRIAVNKMKHQQRKIGIINLKSKNENVLSYFILGPIKEDELGWCPLVYEKRDIPSYFTYRSSIAYHLYNLYKISENLKKILTKINININKFPDKKPQLDSSNLERKFMIAMLKTERLPRRIHYMDYKFQNADIHFLTNRITVFYPQEKNQLLYLAPPINYTYYGKVDGMSPCFNVKRM